MVNIPFVSRGYVASEQQKDMEGSAARSPERHACESSRISMSDERLAEIERAIANGVATGPFGIQLMVLNPQMIPELLAEVKRLRRENHLLKLSRGTPSADVQEDIATTLRIIGQE